MFLSLGATAACAVLGFALAYFISRQPPRAQRLLLVAVIVPFWTSFIVRTYSWVDLLQNLGPIDRLAGTLHLTDSHISILYTPTAIAIGIIYSYLPLMILPIYVSLERIDASIYNAAADLGATPWRQFRRVVLPLAMPGVIAGSIIVGIPALGEYVIPEILGGGKTLMMGNILANQFQNTGNYPFGSALAVTLMGDPDDPALRAPSQAAARGGHVSIRRHPVSALLALLVLLFLWLPLLAVVINSFNKDTLMAGWGGVTGHWYNLAANDHDVRQGLKTTLIIAFASALVSLAVAVSGALWWRRAPRRARAVYDGLVFARIIVPEVVFATALFFLFVHFKFRLGLPAIIIGHSVWNSAYATLIIQARMVGLDPSVEEAAADLGATPWRVFRRVTLHSLMPAIIAAGLLAFTFSFDDVVTSFFLQGTAQSPLPIVLFGLIRFRLTPEVNAIGVLVMLLTVGLMSLAVTMFATANRFQRSEKRAGFLDMYRGR